MDIDKVETYSVKLPPVKEGETNLERFLRSPEVKRLIYDVDCG